VHHRAKARHYWRFAPRVLQKKQAARKIEMEESSCFAHIFTVIHRADDARELWKFSRHV
jgi:hypothetical protein